MKLEHLLHQLNGGAALTKRAEGKAATDGSGGVAAGQALQHLNTEQGYASPRRRPTDHDISKFMLMLEGKMLCDDGQVITLPNSHFRRGIMQEFTNSMENFPTLYNYVLQQSLLGMYPQQPSGMKQIFRVNPRVTDFKLQEIFKGEGLQRRLPRVGRAEEYNERHLTQQEFSYQVAKFGEGFALAYEDLVNDHIGIFRDAPQRLAKAGVQTEEFFMTELLALATGWDATFFDNSDGGRLAGGNVATTALTIDNVEAGISQMLQYTDFSNEAPIVADPTYLVVPPALVNTARNILRSTTILNNGAGGNLPSTSPIMDKNLQLVVNPYLPLVTTTGTIGTTMWGLFTAPSDIAIGEIGFLEGFSAPRVLTKISNSSAPGMGSFENDTFDWKVVHVFGGTQLERRAAFVSNGQ